MKNDNNIPELTVKVKNDKVYPYEVKLITIDKDGVCIKNELVVINQISDFLTLLGRVKQFNIENNDNLSQMIGAI